MGKTPETFCKIFETLTNKHTDLLLPDTKYFNIFMKSYYNSCKTPILYELRHKFMF